MKIVYQVGVWRSEKKKYIKDDEEEKSSRRENEEITNKNKWEYEKEVTIEMNKSQIRRKKQ